MRLQRLALCLPFVVSLLTGCPSSNGGPLTLADLALGDTTVGAAYTKSVSATGGTMPYKFAATGLPAGITITEGTGALSGTATAAGDSSVTVTVTDAAGGTASGTSTLKVYDAPGITNTSLPA